MQLICIKVLGMQTVDHILLVLRAKGFRMTLARQAIIEVLCLGQKPFSAADIHALVTKRKIGADKVTVYRELEFLQREGIVVCVQFQDRNRRYELSSLEHHHHLICQKCEGVQDIHLDEDLETQERAIAIKMKFKVLRHSLEFFGLCQGCQ